MVHEQHALVHDAQRCLKKSEVCPWQFRAHPDMINAQSIRAGGINMRNGKAVLVSGSSKGIGRGIVLAFAKAGYDVAVHYSTSKADAEQVCRLAQAHGVRACLVQGDTADSTVPERMVREAVEKLGRLDVFVANAGFFAKESLTQMSTELMDNLYRVNFRGMVLGAQAAAQYYLQEKIAGCILINTSVRA